MRLVDNKGRLFGLVNLLDLAIAALVIFAAGSIVSNMVMCAGSAKREAAGTRSVMIEVIYRNIPNELASNKDILKPGDSDMSGKAVIEKVLNVRPGSTGDVKDMTVLIKAQCVKLDRQYYYGNKHVRLGLPFTFTAPLYEFSDGTIVSLSVEE